ncbi:hypothetical protein RB195_011271 [Necator americanus]|uniref:Uncharacterized protein n=1 Tax=Necator americanus TaxID=51031 RepID=A0ABR1D4W9_NECAM
MLVKDVLFDEKKQQKKRETQPVIPELMPGDLRKLNGQEVRFKTSKYHNEMQNIDYRSKNGKDHKHRAVFIIHAAAKGASVLGAWSVSCG